MSRKIQKGMVVHTIPPAMVISGKHSPEGGQRLVSSPGGTTGKL
jgi:hypothetical protein